MRALNILIAEDDEQNQALMNLILERMGHHAHSVWNGRDALDAVKTGNFDLVFMDVQMPEMDGLEATRQIRNWENNKKHVPIVILTASVPQRIVEKYKAAGADTYLQKPYNVKRISMMIEIFADEAEKELPLEPDQALPESLADLPLIDMQDSILRFNNDKKFYMDNFTEFLQSLPGRLEKMEKALKVFNWHDLSTFAHNLTGVAGNFGAMQLSELSSRLDQSCRQENRKLAEEIYQELCENVNKLTEYGNTLIEQECTQNSNLLGGQ